MLTETQCAVQSAVHVFAQRELRPRARLYEAAGGYDEELFAKAAEIGLFGLTAPEEYGGSNLDYVSYALAMIELAAGDGALSTIVSIQNSLILGGIAKFGSETQRATLMPMLSSGQAIGAFALTEAQAGSDASAIATYARRCEGGWLLSGEKQFISSGSIASIVMVFAVTDPDRGKRGISAFLVPTNRRGYKVERVESKLGQHASDTCALRFDEMFVGEDELLGDEGAGYAIALSNLEAGRIGIAAQCIGMARTALEIAIAYAKQRRSFGKAIIEHQAVGFRLADLATRLEAARQLVLSASVMMQNGEACLVQSSMAKLFASEVAELVVSGAIQTLGGYGYLEDYELAKIYRDVRVCQIYEGASDIQRMIIARSFT